MTWLMLVYRLPPNRSTRRVYVWRRLKRIGAIYLQDGTCVLPADDRTREQFQWLVAEIGEMAGEAYVCSAAFLTDDQEVRVIDQFREQSRIAYRHVLERIERVSIPDISRTEIEDALRDAWAAFGAARQVDFFTVPEGGQTLARLRAIAAQIEESRQEENE